MGHADMMWLQGTFHTDTQLLNTATFLIMCAYRRNMPYCACMCISTLGAHVCLKHVCASPIMFGRFLLQGAAPEPDGEKFCKSRKYRKVRQGQGCTILP